MDNFGDTFKAALAKWGQITGDTTANPLPRDTYHLNEKMRKYLIGVYQWYYKKDVYASTYDYKVDIERIEQILIQNYYNKKDKDFLNDIKMTILEIEVDMKADKARETEGGAFEDLFN